ncbi:MAG: hypothetical protein ACKOAU_07055 [Pirellula sp.]
MHFAVRILLLLLASPLLLLFVMAPFIALRSIGVASLGMLVGSFGVALACLALMSPSDKIPKQKLTGVPDDRDLPDGVIATRFWQGFFGNIPAAILIDTKQHDLLFIRCLGHRGPSGSPKPEVRLAHQDIKGVYEQIYHQRGIRIVNLHISTKKGRVRLDPSFENFAAIRTYFVNHYPMLSRVPLSNLALFPYFLIFAAMGGLFLGYQFGTSLGQSINPGDPTKHDEWSAAGAIFGPVVAILGCYGFAYLIDLSESD